MASRSRTERGRWRVLVPLVVALVAVTTTALALGSHHYMDTVLFGLVAVAMSGVGIQNARALHENGADRKWGSRARWKGLVGIEDR